MQSQINTNQQKNKQNRNKNNQGLNRREKSKLFHKQKYKIELN